MGGGRGNMQRENRCTVRQCWGDRGRWKWSKTRGKLGVKKRNKKYPTKNISSNALVTFTYWDASDCTSPGEAGDILYTQRNLPPRSTLRNLKHRTAVWLRVVFIVSLFVPLSPESCRPEMEQMRRISETESGYPSEVWLQPRASKESHHQAAEQPLPMVCRRTYVP